jgi:hypothetical protein
MHHGEMKSCAAFSITSILSSLSWTLKTLLDPLSVLPRVEQSVCYSSTPFCVQELHTWISVSCRTWASIPEKQLDEHFSTEHAWVIRMTTDHVHDQLTGYNQLLYDFDCELDRVSLVQAFVLMTYWYDTGIRSKHKDRKFWIREAVTLAQDLGLDLDLENCDTRQRRLFKRIWWCCFMRDQFVALMTWTPPQLRTVATPTCHVPLLVLDDFELEDFSAPLLRAFGDWPLVTSTLIRSHLARLCIDKSKLCLCICRILQARYISFRHESKSQTITVLIPKQATRDLFEIVEYDRQLQQWHRDVAEPRTLDLRHAVAPVNDVHLDLLAIHQAHLQSLFLAAMIALHRPQVQTAYGSSAPFTYQEISRTKLREAAEEIAFLATCLKNLELGTHASPRGMTLFLPILLVHLQDIHPDVIDSLPSQRSLGLTTTTRLEKYHRCMLILDSIGGIPALSEDSLSAELESAFRNLNILPSPSSSLQQSSIPPLMPLFGASDVEDSFLSASLRFTGKKFDTSHFGIMTRSEATLLADLNPSLASVFQASPNTASSVQPFEDFFYDEEEGGDEPNSMRIDESLRQSIGSKPDLITAGVQQLSQLHSSNSPTSPVGQAQAFGNKQAQPLQSSWQRPLIPPSPSTLPEPIFQTRVQFAASLHNEAMSSRQRH